MAWTDTPCDVEARTKQGLPSGVPRTSRAHVRIIRIMWSRFYGIPWPEGLFACHHCDEPRCSNPQHIFPGTHGENIKDAFNKRGAWGSIQRGEKHGPAKLALEDVIQIRKLLRKGESQGQIGKYYGIAQSTVSNIATGKRWGWSS
jgi:hypothetical protein